MVISASEGDLVCESIPARLRPADAGVTLMASSTTTLDALSRAIKPSALDRTRIASRYPSRVKRLYFVRRGGQNTGTLYTVGIDGSGERAVTDLRGRRGTLISHSLASDGNYLYFSWQEDLADIWLGGTGSVTVCPRFRKVAQRSMSVRA